MKPPKQVYRRNLDRSSETQPLRQAIDALLKSYQLDAKFSHERIKLHWEEIMGAPIASRTEQLFVKQGVLYVKLNSAPLKQDLSMRKQKVLEHIHAFSGTKAISDVIFI